MPKDNKQFVYDDPDQLVGTCFDCDNANYICEGDYLCDAYHDSPCVISDWVPTKFYCKCGGKRYKPV